MEKFFKIRERGSSVGTEVLGGLTTFLAMAYIIAVNPTFLQAAGMDFTAALTATCFGAAIMTIIMGLVSNRPIALASGMGVNAIVAFTLCGATGLNVDWRVAMAVVFVEGLVILVLVLCGLRKAIMDAIPKDLRFAIGIGIGLFIAFIGLKSGGIIVTNPDNILGAGDFTTPQCALALFSIVVAVLLTARKVKGALLLSIVITTIVGIPAGVTPMPGNLNFGLDFSAFAAPFQTDPATGTVALTQVFLQPALLLFVFSLLMSDFFDTMGTVVAVGERGGFTDKNGNVDNIQSILTVDSIAAAVGGFLGASSVTTFVESSAGASAGARTGLSNLVVGALFIICAFFAPLVGMVSGAATCGALVVVGYLMMTSIGGIEWNRIESAFPAFLTIVGIPFTYSITNGIGLGFISYCLVMTAQGRAREVHPLMWGASAAFLFMFIFQ